MVDRTTARRKVELAGFSKAKPYFIPHCLKYAASGWRHAGKIGERGCEQKCDSCS
jgi:hypothetical protein